MSGTQTSGTKLALPSNILCIMISSFNVLRVLLSLDTYQHIVDAKGSSLRIPERIFNNIIRVSEQISRSFLLHYIRWAERLPKNLVKSLLVCWVCHVKILQTGGLNQQKFVFSQLWRLKIQDPSRFLGRALCLAWRHCLLPLSAHGEQRRHGELPAVCSW